MTKNFTRALLLLLSFAMLLSFSACKGSEHLTTDLSETTQSSSESSRETSESENSDTNETTENISETEGETTETIPENLILGDEVQYAADFTVSQVFGNNMVIQRNEYIRLWGWAEESENGKKVSASFMGMTADALIEDGAWELTLYARLPANIEGNTLKVYTDSKEIVFNDVLVGDVFMIIGQSNVQQSINDYMTYPATKEKWDIANLDKDALIRMNYNSNTDSVGYPTRGTTEVCPDVVTNNGWVIPDEENLLRLSALGYLTALKITELTENQIPVGIAQFSANGRPLSVFMPNELAEQYGSDHFDETEQIYKGNYHASVVTRYMYNHYIYPYERMPIAGLIWYQGEAESNIKLSSVFAERFTALMTYMRSTHNLVNADFPVFLVELPTIYKKPAGADRWEYLDTGRIRAAQGTIPMSLEGCYMISSSDLWTDQTHWNNVHPYIKYEQAERIVALMDSVIYGDRAMDEVSGPILDSWTISNDHKTITLKFKNCGEGLTTSDGGTAVKGFAGLSKKNDIDTKATVTAEITAPDTVTVTSNRALSGVAYHYVAEYFFGIDINLCNSFGIPAVAFWICEDIRS